ncbi:MAG: hypothetical protein L6Q98_13075 [Anaerolineae bacterium]|nr:hypothetical protein [Anaerolineae bacterium]NUQ03276.1 hypothetical protein [Anaerolineae bacterium]
MTDFRPPREDLSADPAALEAWQHLPQSQPTPSALPPMTGGIRWNRLFVWGFVFLALFALILMLANPGGGS